MYPDHHEKGEYRVCIDNFTNEDRSAYVLIVKDGSEIWTGGVGFMSADDTGSSKKVVYFRAFNKSHEPLDWADEYERTMAEKTIQTSICDFTVIVP